MKGWQITFLFYAVLLLCAGLLPLDAYGTQNSEPVLVAHTQHPLATAYNNGRRIARSTDDERFLMYMDARQDTPLVCFTKSIGGVTWTEPRILAKGSFPSMSIDVYNNLYAVWASWDSSEIQFVQSGDRGDTWTDPPIAIRATGHSVFAFPVVEVSYWRVHLAWQRQDDPLTAQIMYASHGLIESTPPFSDVLTISDTSAWAGRPAIATNVDHAEGFTHLVWPQVQGPEFNAEHTVMYRRFNEGRDAWYPPLDSAAFALTAPEGLESPAISVDAGEGIHVLSCSTDSSGFWSTLFEGHGDEIISVGEAKIETSCYPWVTIDDPIPLSVTIAWLTDYGEIVYGQTVNAEVLTDTSYAVSTVDGVASLYPNLCYRNFRGDSLDVVWTDGDHPPYSVYYRRMAKKNPWQSVDEEHVANRAGPSQIKLFQNTPNPFNSRTRIEYQLPPDGKEHGVELKVFDILGQLTRTLLQEEQSDLSFATYWDGTDDLGRSVPSGVYVCVLHVGDFVLSKKMLFVR